MENQEIDFNEDREKRRNFMKEIKLSLEQEYNAPQKPAIPEKVDRKMLKTKLKTIIDSFKEKNNMTFEEIIKYILDRINEDRKINPNAKGEYEVLEEVLYDMTESEKEVDL
ncbi:MAG: hypothetical protein ACI4U9_04800 [Clostridia bacterium]